MKIVLKNIWNERKNNKIFSNPDKRKLHSESTASKMLLK